MASLIAISVGLANIYIASAAGPFSKGPYIQFPAPGEVTIMWEGAQEAPGTVRFGVGEQLNHTVGPVLPERKQSHTSKTSVLKSTNAVYYLYKAVLTGLSPATEYSYSVELNGTTIPARKFRTLDPHARSTSFIVYGDSRSDPKKHLAVTRNFARYNPEFILHTGDLVAKGTDYSLWSTEFFTPTAEVIDHIPFFSVIGNHEQDGTNYLNYFDLPGNKLWYSLDVGPVHVLALDFRYEKATHEQFAFAQADLLGCRAPWKIVILHTPVYNLGGHASAWGHAAYLPLFHQAQVDLVLSGHSHMYERFRPVVRPDEKVSWPITHITTGGGGANLHTALAHPALFSQETTNHFMVFEATANALKGRAIRIDGSLIDAFEIRKSAGRLDPAYVAQAYDEKALNLFYEGAPALTPKVAAVPTPSDPVDLQFVISPRKKASIAKFEITLTPEAARYYELIGAPLKATTPRAGKTNVVWAKVRSTGQTNVVQNSSKELVPALAFQARIKAREGSTLTYGTKAKVVKLEPPPPATSSSPDNPVLRSPKWAAAVAD